MIGIVLTKWKLISQQSGVKYLNFDYFVELDFDYTGKYLVSCGDDLNWMIWAVNDKTFTNKGIIN